MHDVPSAPATPPLVGRDDELLLVEQLLAGAEPAGSALVLSGEPGVGKTAVLRAAAALAEAQGFTVLTVQGVEFEAELTFAGLHQLLLPVDAYTEQLPAAQRTALEAAMGIEGAASADGLVISAAVVALLRAAAADRRLLLLVDDFHWLDRASARTLTFVARRISSVPAVLLCTVRTGADELLIRSGLPTQRLPPLTQSDASALLHVRYPTLVPAVRERLLEEANGNPLALLELPSALSAEQHVDFRSLPSVLPLNDRLKATFGSRFVKLPESSRRIVLQAALAGSPQLSALQLSSDVEQDLAALQLAQEERLVRIDSGQLRLTFAHPLIRTAVVELSTAAEVRAAHLTLAERETTEPDRRAWHLASAAVEADESVAALLEQTALRNLQRGDPANAIETLLRAAELSPDEHRRNTRLLHAAFLAANLTGDVIDIETLMSQAEAGGDPDESLYAAAAAAATSIVSGYCDVTAVFRLLVQTVRAHGGTYLASNAALIAAVNAMSRAAYLVGRPDAWEEYFAIVDRLSPHPPRDVLLMRTTFADPARATADSLEQLRSAIAGLLHETDLETIAKIATASIFLDGVAGCLGALQKVVDSSVGNDNAVVAPSAMLCIAAHEFASGQWDEAERWHERGIALSIERGIPGGLYPQHYRLGKIAALRGKTNKARECIDVILDWAMPRHALGPLEAVRHIQTLLAVSASDYEAAYTAASAMSPPGQFTMGVGLAIEVSLDLVEACVHTGRQVEAAAHVTEMRRLGIARLSSRCALRVAGCTAIAAAKNEATTLFEIALATPEAGSWPYELARIQLAYGQHLRRNKGSVADARRQLTAARDGFDRLGAAPWSARAAAELRASPSSRSRGSSDRPSVLTPQERQIALLAATGLSNKEIAKRVYLSDRTVGAHLYRVYPKLGITSRAALRDALGGLDDD
jgi:DNA-binding CsgD family transcriptional regulator